MKLDFCCCCCNKRGSIKEIKDDYYYNYISKNNSPIYYILNMRENYRKVISLVLLAHQAKQSK